MIAVVLRVAALAAIGCTTAVCADAAAQESAPVPSAAPAAALVEDEVIVRGQRPAQLRVEIELAENAFYERFNAINSNDEFDIACRDVVLIGSKIPRRVCEPQYARAADAAFSASTVRGLQGSSSAGSPQQFTSLKQIKHGRLQEELRKLVIEDAQLLDALTRLTTLQQEYEALHKN